MEQDLKKPKRIWPWILGWYLSDRFCDRIIPESWTPTLFVIMMVSAVAALLFLAWREYRQLTR